MTYEVHVTGREGRWWAVEIPALGAGARTQARRLSEVAEEARDYIAVTLDVVPSTVQVEVVIDDFGQVCNLQQRSAWIRAARRLIEQLEDDVQRETKVLTGDLAAEGVPMREIAELVGTTFQRVGQIANDDAQPVASAWDIHEANPAAFDQARDAFFEVSRLVKALAAGGDPAAGGQPS